MPSALKKSKRELDSEKKETPEVHLIVYASATGDSSSRKFGTAVSEVDWSSIQTKHEAVSDTGFAICGQSVTHHFRTTQPAAVRQKLRSINREEHLKYEAYTALPPGIVRLVVYQDTVARYSFGPNAEHALELLKNSRALRDAVEKLDVSRWEATYDFIPDRFSKGFMKLCEGEHSFRMEQSFLEEATTVLKALPFCMVRRMHYE